ncbi:hypothetical protein DQ04_13471010 [Trypanosoma grayi]|uniref:hypothetical protein n=1 Tax=Trypanosoma grayi TaxID=71804 RepID=UPI0004F40C97|nr:hypothetical protein DQ04_13471010 [Trypanosoma grayi]KEG06530.1 hypothetical protein DQ04_13471010 [Trypanosoma grayi]
MSQVQSHIDELRRRFENVRVVRQIPSETLLQVDQTSTNCGYLLVLYVALDANFPRSPPTVAYFNGRRISIAAETGTADVWDPAKSRLADAVSNAFANLANMWGSVGPPSMNQISSQLSLLSDSMLQDIISYPSCLESYAYQLPFTKGIRDASGQTIDEIERVAKENLTLQPEVAQLQKEVEELQQRLSDQIGKLQEMQGSLALLNSIKSPEVLAKTFAADVKTLDTQCDDIAKDLLAVNYSTDKRRFDELLEQYRLRAKERHIMDLKRRAYYASIS